MLYMSEEGHMWDTTEKGKAQYEFKKSDIFIGL